jgi:hypothetical protein
MRNNIKYILLFGLVASFLIFGFLFVRSVIGDNIIVPFADQMKIVAGDMSLDPVITSEIDNAVGYFQNFDLSADLIFLITWIFFEVSLVIMAVKSPRLPSINFMTILLTGTMFMIFIFDFIEQFSSWFITNFINAIFTSSETYLPIFNFYREYEIIIIFFNLIMILLINQIMNKEEKNISDEGFTGDVQTPVFNSEVVRGQEE